MKYTLCITRKCNLDCSYCYIGKSDDVMPYETAVRIIDHIFHITPPGKDIQIGFFGGEPLTEFDLIKKITSVIEEHPSYGRHDVQLNLVTNGTIFSCEIAEFINAHDIGLCISCDGPPDTHNIHRKFKNGLESSTVVEQNIKNYLASLPELLVNAVFTSNSFECLSETVEYFLSLGIKKIYLNPDFSADWSKISMDKLSKIYKRVADIYYGRYISGDPIYINMIDTKIAVILRGGYQAEERCQMGKREFAYTPNGDIYPCERLIGNIGEHMHRIGNITDGADYNKMACSKFYKGGINPECGTCGIKDYCMNNCGCSNYFSSGSYDRVGPFLCASEKAAINAAFDIFKALNNALGAVFLDHLAGRAGLSVSL